MENRQQTETRDVRGIEQEAEQEGDRDEALGMGESITRSQRKN